MKINITINVLKITLIKSGFAKILNKYFLKFNIWLNMWKWFEDSSFLYNVLGCDCLFINIPQRNVVDYAQCH